MEKINIAELLKDCPQGMELDCLIYENVYFDKVSDDKKAYYPILCYITDEKGNRSSISFTKNGCESMRYGAKCVIFPKGKTNWERFNKPFKDGDIAISESGDIHLLKTSSSSYCAYRDSWEILPKFDSTITTNVTIVRLATEEEKQKLFQAIKDNGYKWNSETKTLENLPKFKVEDKIEKCGYRFTIVEIKDNYYLTKCGNKIPIAKQDDWELVPNKFDITALKPFDKVLVRDFDNTPWEIDFFSRLLDGKHFKCVDLSYVQCIPYEENKHLLGTTNDCDDFYKTWE